MKIVKIKTITDTTIEVTVQADNREDFEGRTAAEYAKKEARQAGYNVSGLGNIPSVFPVNADGDIIVRNVDAKPIAGYISKFQFGVSI